MNREVENLKNNNASCMVIAPHTIKRSSGATKSKKRVGRGNGSGKGTYSARGMKGQRARSGGKSGTQRLGFKPSLLKVPKLRGFKSMYPASQTVTVGTLERAFDAGASVSPQILQQKGIVASASRSVKIVMSGKLTKALIVSGCLATGNSVVAIEKAGGTISF